jgi:acetolactate synthase-1/2/3 large subunit
MTGFGRAARAISMSDGWVIDAILPGVAGLPPADLLICDGRTRGRACRPPRRREGSVNRVATIARAPSHAARSAGAAKEARVARLGQQVPRLLAERGIEVAFGVPALQSLELYRGLNGSGLRHLCARTAAGAGFMAEGYARLAGRPAAVFLGGGPSIAGLAPAMGQALSESQPMLALTANLPADRRRPGEAAMVADAPAMLKGVARWSRAIGSVADLVEALDAAAALFAAARPGPVHFDVAADVLAAEAGAIDAPAPVAPAPAAPTAAEVAEAVMRLSIARNPLTVLGGGALALGVKRAVALVERVGGPVLLTANARGLIPADHPLHLGGRYQTEPVRALISGADAVLAIGTELAPAEWTPTGAPFPAFAADALIRVDRDPAQLSRPVPAAFGAACDAVAFVDALLESLPARGGATPDLGPLRARALAATPPRLSRHQPLLDALWEHLPEAVVVGDPCEPVYAGVFGASPPAPRRWFSAATGFGALGYAIPAAVGAKVADHRRPVVALVGDGGALAAFAELSAAVEAGAHVIVLVWNNSGFNETREQMRGAQIRPVAVDLAPVDFQSLARAYGAVFARVSGLDYLRDALRGAVTRPGPSVIELREEFWFG